MKAFLALLFSMVLAPAHAAVVGFNPGHADVEIGSTFVVLVDGSGFASELDGGGLDLAFDPAILQLKSVQIDLAEWNFFSDAGSVDNVAGTATGAQFNQFGKAKIGSFTILGYEFQAIQRGHSALTLTEYALNPFASGGAAVPTTFNVGSVTVVPEPSTGWLLAGGLGMLVLGIARRRN